ncbi:MAG TPA: protein phosphatase 2C domain-containing protein [Bryobacteraceae bacterium]|nr:protein phosphatase 2C domain-containing protein [Bryobacteraceae bacterium]
MPETSGSAAWGVYGGSTRGSSHLRSGLPNQDSLGKWSGPNGSVAVLAVSDGHGSAAHFRSDTGSQIGVETAVQTLRATPLPIPDGHSQVLAESIVETWRQAVLAHLEAHPFTDQEWAKLPPKDAAQMKVAILANPTLAYGATLLAVLAAASEILYLQLGDGDILAVDQNGRTTRPVPEDSRLIANQTTSLCQKGAAKDFRAAHYRASLGAPPALILVSSDGYSNSFMSDEDFLRLGPDYLELLREYGPEKVEAQLEKILPEASRKGSGDDITLGFVHRINNSAKPAPGPAPLTAEPVLPASRTPGDPAHAEAVATPAAVETPPSAPAGIREPSDFQGPPEPKTRRERPVNPEAAVLKDAGKAAPDAEADTVETMASPRPIGTSRPAADEKPQESSARRTAEESVTPRRKLFWLKLALAGICVLALAGGGLAWFRPFWFTSFIERIRSRQHEPREHPGGKAPYRDRDGHRPVSRKTWRPAGVPHHV